MPHSVSRDPIFIFTDPGIDDALALAMATSESFHLRIIGACAVDGNVPAKVAGANLSRLFRLFGAGAVPVFQSSLNDPTHDYPYSVHGRNGLGNVKLAESKSHVQINGVADFLKTQGRFRILSMGPLTAVSELIAESPEVAKQISECVIMGGGISLGNVTPYTEFNIHSNPDAADGVFRSDVAKVLVPLDITEKVCLYSGDLELLKRSRRQKTKRLAEMLEFYFRFQRKKNGFFGAYMHDPTAVAAMVTPELFRFRKAEVRVDTTRGKTRGRTVATFSQRGDTRIAVSVEAAAVRTVIMDALAS